MNFSFVIPSKPSSKKQSSLKSSQHFNGDEQDPSTKEYVTVFDPSKSSDQQSGKLVIPPQPNEWRPHKKMKNLELPLRPSDRPDLHFEVESAAPADGGPNISYGLNIRNSNAGATADAMNVEPDERSPPLPRPAPVEMVMLEKLKEDLKRLPDDRGFDEYTDMPVEGFGAALLAGYGWYEGRGIGKNAKQDVKAVQYERRTAKEGLGFVSEIPSENNNGGSSASRKKEKPLRSREGEEGRFSVGKEVRIVGGRDVGLKGKIVEVMGGANSVILKLSRSEEEVKVRTHDVAELGSMEEERCMRKLKELKIGSKDEKGGNDRRKDEDSSRRRGHRDSKEEKIDVKMKDNRESRDEGRSERREEPRTAAQVSWLTSHIRVKIISKELKGGRLYLKKGEVMDVVGPAICDILVDDSRELIQGVDQDHLETALPRRGGQVLVLSGKHKGVYGNLMERDTENETATVRDSDTHELFNVHLDQIAEYIGDPSIIGY